MKATKATTQYICDDCGAVGEFSSYIEARAADWAISRDYKTCYCPECAPPHRLGGANGKTTAPAKWQPEYVQLEIKV